MRMRKNSIFFAGCWFLVSAFTNEVGSKDKGGFKLKGQLDGMPSESVVYLVDEVGDTSAQSTMHNGAFELTGTVMDGARIYRLFISKDISTTNKSNYFWLENKDMLIKGDVQEFGNLELKGSPSQDDFVASEALIKKTKKLDLPALKEFIVSRPSSLFAPNLLYRVYPHFELKEVRDMYEKMSPEVQQSYYGEQLITIVKRLEEYPDYFAKGPKNMEIPDFEVKTLLGDKISLKSILRKNKLTLVDIWASWCVPCRGAIPELKSVYDKYNDKGFNIVGLSVDKSRQAWKKAVQEDNTPWEHYADKVSMGARQVFGVWNLPAYFLIDSEGKVLFVQNMIIQRPENAEPTDIPFVSSKNDRLMHLVDSLLSK